VLGRLPLLLTMGAAAACSSAANCEVIGALVPSSSGFRDDLWIGGEPRGTKTLIPPMSLPGLVRLSLKPSLPVFRIDERLATISTDAAANTRLDITGHAVSVSGLTVVICPEASSEFGLTTSWAVDGEQTLDNVGEHSWTVLPADTSPNARWLPIASYRFENSSASTAQPASAIPEPSSWTLIGVGLALLSWVALVRHPSVVRAPAPAQRGTQAPLANNHAFVHLG